EFKPFWEQLPSELHTWLAHNPAGTAYQVIMVARPSQAAPTQPSDTKQRQWLSSWPGKQTDPGSTAAANELPATPRANDLENKLTQAQQQLDQLEASHAALQAELQAMRTSGSWRLTAPLRALARRLKP